MKLSALHHLIATGESLVLELKKSTAEKDLACRYLRAPANGQGWQVVFGVRPGGKVVGQKVIAHTLEELAQGFLGFKPPLIPQLQGIPVSQEDTVELEALLVLIEGGQPWTPAGTRVCWRLSVHRRAWNAGRPELCLP